MGYRALQHFRKQKRVFRWCYSHSAFGGLTCHRKFRSQGLATLSSAFAIHFLESLFQPSTLMGLSLQSFFPSCGLLDLSKESLDSALCRKTHVGLASALCRCITVKKAVVFRALRRFSSKRDPVLSWDSWPLRFPSLMAHKRVFYTHLLPLWP